MYGGGTGEYWPCEANVLPSLTLAFFNVPLIQRALELGGSSRIFQLGLGVATYVSELNKNLSYVRKLYVKNDYADNVLRTRDTGSSS